jgi:hypothetical protein
MFASSSSSARLEVRLTVMLDEYAEEYTEWVLELSKFMLMVSLKSLS